MSNIHLAYISVYQRISDIFHKQAYASKIRYSVIPPLVNVTRYNSGVERLQGGWNCEPINTNIIGSISYIIRVNDL